jgi:hypothetical protein
MKKHKNMIEIPQGKFIKIFFSKNLKKFDAARGG